MKHFFFDDDAVRHCSDTNIPPGGIFHKIWLTVQRFEICQLYFCRRNRITKNILFHLMLFCHLQHGLGALQCLDAEKNYFDSGMDFKHGCIYSYSYTSNINLQTGSKWIGRTEIVSKIRLINTLLLLMLLLLFRRTTLQYARWW